MDIVACRAVFRRRLMDVPARELFPVVAGVAYLAGWLLEEIGRKSGVRGVAIGAFAFHSQRLVDQFPGRKRLGLGVALGAKFLALTLGFERAARFMAGKAVAHFKWAMLFGVDQVGRRLRGGMRVMAVGATGVLHREIVVGLFESRLGDCVARFAERVFRFRQHEVIFRGMRIMALGAVAVSHGLVGLLSGKARLLVKVAAVA